MGKKKVNIDWRAKLADSKDLPKVEKIAGKMSTKWGTGTVVIPAPLEVNALMKKVRKGKVTTFEEIRAELARKHKASIGCPITTGIFALVSAKAAADDAADGKKRITPYWRTLKNKGELNPKFPGGLEEQKRVLESEGHTVVSRGKKMYVQDYEKRLAKLSSD